MNPANRQDRYDRSDFSGACGWPDESRSSRHVVVIT